MSAIAATGCSLAPGDPVGVASIRLVSEQAPSLSIFSWRSSYLGAFSVSDFNCFGVMARVEGVPNPRVCRDQFSQVAVSGFKPGASSTFELMLPSTGTLSLEAFGTNADPCPNFGGVLSGAPDSRDFFRLGSVVVGAAQANQPEYVIPIRAQEPRSWRCSPTGYYQEHGDDFNYAGGLLATNIHWTTTPTSNQFPLNGSAIDVAGLGGSSYQVAYARTVSRAYRVTISLVFHFTGQSSSGAIFMGVDDANLFSGNGLACKFLYSNVGPDVTYTAGSFSTGMGTVSGSTSGANAVANGETHVLVCEIEASGGSVAVNTMAFQLGSQAQIGSTITYTGADVPAANIVLLATGSGGNFAAASTIDKFTIGVQDGP